MKSLLLFLSSIIPLWAQSPGAIQGEIAALQKEKFALEKTYLAAQEEIEKAFQELDALDAQEKNILGSMDQTKNELKKSARLVTQLSGHNPLRFLANPEESQNIPLKSVIIRSLTRAIAQKKNNLERQREHHTLLKEQKESILLILNDLEEKMAARFDQIDALKNEKVALWRDLSASRAGPGPRTISVKTLETQTDVVTEATQTLENIKKGEGESVLPTLTAGHINLILPVRGDPSVAYGSFEQGQIKGNGIVFDLKREQSVMSPARGRVVHVGNLKNSPTKTMIIEHDKSNQSILIGLDHIQAGQGQTVYAGQSIGSMPTYGPAHPKLYWEFRHDNTPMNPLPYLKKQTRGQHAL